MPDRSAAARPPAPSDPIRLVLVEPRAMAGLGVRELLDREPDIELVAEVRSSEQAVAVVAEEAPDIVLVDVELGDSEASEAARRLRQSAPDAGFVTVGPDDDASLLGAIEVGASAHVDETGEPADLVAAIRSVADGNEPIKADAAARPDLVEMMVDAVRDGFARADERPMPLTGRELELLRLVGAGLRNRDIAAELGISEQTVKNHLTSVLQKIGVSNRTQAVTHAVRQGWIVLGEVGTALARPGAAQRPPTDT